MKPATLRIGRRKLQYAVSDNTSASQWAVSFHGYLAGGRPYWRESAILAERMGWRLVNPSLAGFGGSTPLRSASIRELADDVGELMEHLGAGPAVVLGHSMGGAVAVRYAADRPAQTVGLIYRAGVATPAWKHVLGPYLGVLGMLMPIGIMLLGTDLRDEVASLDIPVLAEWGCFDHVVGQATAEEFARGARTPIQWVPGGHSWMLTRPGMQADVLEHLELGREFVYSIRAPGVRRR
jgi:pimeloyl-ACP methyl ester carboxylesterase